MKAAKKDNLAKKSVAAIEAEQSDSDSAEENGETSDTDTKRMGQIAIMRTREILRDVEEVTEED